MIPCVCNSGVSRVPSQRGHSGQPSPEPVNRTAAPVNTISVHTASAAYAIRRNSRGVNVRRRTHAGTLCSGSTTRRRGGAVTDDREQL